MQILDLEAQHRSHDTANQRLEWTKNIIVYVFVCECYDWRPSDQKKKKKWEEENTTNGRPWVSDTNDKKNTSRYDIYQMV